MPGRWKEADMTALINTIAIRIGEAVYNQFTLPVVFDDRYFVVEQAAGHSQFTVFGFDGDNLVVDFLRNHPPESVPGCHTDAAGNLVKEDLAGVRYRILPGGAGVESAIQMTPFSTLWFPVHEGQIVLG